MNYLKKKPQWCNYCLEFSQDVGTTKYELINFSIRILFEEDKKHGLL